MKIDRREFVKFLGTGALTAILPSMPSKGIDGASAKDDISDSSSSSSSSRSSSSSCTMYKPGEKIWFGDLVQYNPRDGMVYRMKSLKDGNALGWCGGMTADEKMAYIISDWITDI